MTDAIIGRGTRPSLPAGALSGGNYDVSQFELVGVDEVWVMQQPMDTLGGFALVLWPMRLGYPWLQ